MISFRFLLLVTLLATIDADNWFTRRRYQKEYQNSFFQRPLSSHFRHRIGSGRSPMNSYREYQQRELAPTASASTEQRDGAAPSYPAPAYDSYSSNYNSYASHEGSGVNPLSALVAPLAALALLGAAAAVSTNPVLLSIAVLSSGRKRRALMDNGDEVTPELEEQLQEMEVLEKYMAKLPGQEEQQEKLMATYLSCSGFTESDNKCLDRVVCEYSVVHSKMMGDLEKDVISIVLFNIMSNVHVPKEYKERLRTAAQYGRARGQCSVYTCNQLAQKLQ